MPFISSLNKTRKISLIYYAMIYQISINYNLSVKIQKATIGLIAHNIKPNKKWR